MTNLEKFLVDLTDSEIAVFVAYRFEDFLGNSKRKIINEVNRRELSRERLDELFKKGLPKENNSTYMCPQCNSHRYNVEIDYELRQSTRSCSYEVAIESNRCQICGYNPEKNTQKGFLKKMKKLFGCYRSIRRKDSKIDDRMFT